jgi:hypothetical protein
MKLHVRRAWVSEPTRLPSSELQLLFQRFRSQFLGSAVHLWRCSLEVELHSTPQAPWHDEEVAMLQVGLISDDLECYAEYLVMQLSSRYEWWKMHQVQLPLVGSRPLQWKQVVLTLVQLV